MGQATRIADEPRWRRQSDPDQAFALRCVRAGLSGVDDAEIGAALADGAVDWRAIMALLFANRLATLASRGLGPAAALLPDWVRREFDYFQAVTTRKNAANLLTLRRMLPQFRDAGVDLLVFKGPALQHRVYGSLFIRPSSDLDILVAGEDFNRATAVLFAQGYRRDASCRSAWWRLFLGEQHFSHDAADAVTVDVHHRVQQPGCPYPKRPGDFFDQRQWMAVGATAVPVLSDVHAVLLTAMSLAKALNHRDAGGRYAADLAAMALAMDGDAWRAVRGEAARQGLSNTLDLGLRAVGVLFSVSVAGWANPGVMSRVADDVLADMLVRPDLPGLAWPSRRSLLWDLCDQKHDYPAGRLLMVGSDVARAVLEPDLPTQAPPPPRPASKTLSRPVEARA